MKFTFGGVAVGNAWGKGGVWLQLRGDETKWEVSMLVGVISDIHGLLGSSAAHELELCDMILCAGDVERPSVLMELDAIAPTIAVLGNCDRHAFVGEDLPLVATPRIGGVRFYMVHRPEDIGSLPDDVQVVVHGHTHIPREEYRQGVLYLNPGSATRPRGGSKKSLARLTLDRGAVQNVEFVELSAL